MGVVDGIFSWLRLFLFLVYLCISRRNYPLQGVLQQALGFVTLPYVLYFTRDWLIQTRSSGGTSIKLPEDNPKHIRSEARPTEYWHPHWKWMVRACRERRGKIRMVIVRTVQLGKIVGVFPAFPLCWTGWWTTDSYVNIKYFVLGVLIQIYWVLKHSFHHFPFYKFDAFEQCRVGLDMDFPEYCKLIS